MAQKETENIVVEQERANSHLNAGEIAELNSVEFLLYASPEELVNIFGEEAREGINLIDPASLNIITNANSNGPAPNGYKSDYIVWFVSNGDMHFVSFKDGTGNNYSIMSETRRKLLVRNPLTRPWLFHIDRLCQFYAAKRIEGVWAQDIRLTEIIETMETNGDRDVRGAMLRLIEYFTFKGTGKGISIQVANCVLVKTRDRENPYTFYDCKTKARRIEYCENLLSRYVFSLRGIKRGSTKGYEVDPDDEPWVFEDPNSGRLKGKMSIRVARQ